MKPIPDPDPSLNRFLEHLEDAPDNRAYAEVTLELKALGIHAEVAIKSVINRIHTLLEEDRLSWKTIAARQKAAFEEIKKTSFRWVNATTEDIETAYQDCLVRGKTDDSLALAFRGKKNLSVRDKAILLDSLNIIKLVPSSANK